MATRAIRSVGLSVSLSAGLLQLAPRGESRISHLPVDQFFRSLAEDRQTGAIGVILSGNGSDGTLGVEEIKDNSGRNVQEALLPIWANLKQRALGPALQEINKESDIQLELEFIGRGTFRKVESLAFRITARKHGKR